MLVLTRHKGQKLFIGENITVCIVEVRPGGGVRIGIEAPEEVVVLRDDAIVKERKQKEGEQQ